MLHALAPDDPAKHKQVLFQLVFFKQLFPDAANVHGPVVDVVQGQNTFFGIELGAAFQAFLGNVGLV
jgi:hypothetical protein